MRSRITYPVFVVIFLSAPLLLVACTGVSDSARAPDPRLDQLVAGMDQCLAGQAQAAEQLQHQEQQLAQQQQQLRALTGALGRVAGAASPDAEEDAAAPVSQACEPVTQSPEKLLVGQLEQVWLQNLQLSLPARIDTGAETASLDARNIELFERNGHRWVRFEILNPETGESLPLERKLKRMVVIVQSNTAEPERRPVIKMNITVGHISQSAEFTLSNRSHLDYQVLVGRNILKDFMVVDVSQENIAPFVLPAEPEDAGAPP